MKIEELNVGDIVNVNFSARIKSIETNFTNYGVETMAFLYNAVLKDYKIALPLSVLTKENSNCVYSEPNSDINSFEEGDKILVGFTTSNMDIEAEILQMPKYAGDLLYVKFFNGSINGINMSGKTFSSIVLLEKKKRKEEEK